METKRIVSNCGGKSINKRGKNKNLVRKKIIWGAHALAMFFCRESATGREVPVGGRVCVWGGEHSFY